MQLSLAHKRCLAIRRKGDMGRQSVEQFTIHKDAAVSESQNARRRAASLDNLRFTTDGTAGEILTADLIVYEMAIGEKPKWTIVSQRTDQCAPTCQMPNPSPMQQVKSIVPRLGSFPHRKVSCTSGQEIRPR